MPGLLQKTVAYAKHATRTLVQVPALESEYRYAVLSICVFLVAFALTWTGDSILQNLPLALFAVGTTVWLYQKQNALYQLAKRGEEGSSDKEKALSRISSAVDARKGSDTGWRHLVRAPKVEESWETLCSCIVQEFIYDLWYIFITSDVEFPAVVRVILNGAFGELALRGRALDIPSIICDTCEAISEQLELFRNTREAVGPSFKHLSYAKRDYKLKQQLQKEGLLHPAVANEKQGKQTFKIVFDTVSKILLKKEDASRPVLRIIVRELLANSVVSPLLVYFTPASGNALLLWALNMSSGEEDEEALAAAKKKEEEEAAKAKQPQGDIKWRAKQSEEFENKQKHNPTPCSPTSESDKNKSNAKKLIPPTIAEADENEEVTRRVSHFSPSFSCRPVVRVLSADEKYYQNIHGKKRFVVYTIRVKEGYKQWYIYRRYRNFSTLHRRMRILPEYNFKLPPKRILYRHMSDQFVQNRCDSLNLYIHQLLHSSVWQCQEVWDFLSEKSEVYGIESREEENVLQRLKSDIEDVSKSVGKKFETAYSGFGNILANEYRRVGNTSGKIVKGVLFEWRKKTVTKDTDARPSAQELSEQVKLFQELQNMKKRFSLNPNQNDIPGIEKSEDELIKDYLSEVTQELYIRTAVDNMTAPILDVIDVLFQLDTKDWLRRQVVGATKQLFEVFVGSRVEKFLMSKVKMLCTEETVASIIDSITDALWPNGIWMIPPEEEQNQNQNQNQQAKGGAAPQTRPRSSSPVLSSPNFASPSPLDRKTSFKPPSTPTTPSSQAGANGPALKRCSTTLNEGKIGDSFRIQRALSSLMPPEHIEIVNDEETEVRKKVQEKLKDLVVPTAVSTLIGKRNFLQGVQDLFEFIQSETMMAQLGHLVLEIILVKEFPELEPEYARIRSGDLSYHAKND